MSEISELLQTYYNDQKAWNADYVCVIFSFFDSYFHQILNNYRYKTSTFWGSISL